ncbi:MAG: hypothetical protein QGF07_05055 [Phycisphaerales bacterium]|jgi:hypothetical protein|nr:hypothetical protein [Phycisphaerales bacterium]
MTTNDYDQTDIKRLLELAVLDAYGLLEPMESDLFNRAFHDAPATLQDEIRLLQEDISIDDSLLPNESPDATLRRRVLDAVAKAADEEANRLAPLALIGARAGATRHKQNLMETSSWRAVAMVLFGISVVLAAFSIKATDRANNITKYALNVDAEHTLADLVGSEFGEFINNPSCPAQGLERVDGNTTGYIRVAINERTGAGYILAIDLEDDEELIIQGTTPDGKIIELARISSSNTPVVAQKFSVEIALAGSLSYRAVDNSGKVVWS